MPIDAKWDIIGRWPDKDESAILCLPETRPESKFHFCPKTSDIATCNFALMKFPLFYLLMDTEVHNQSVFIKDVSLDMFSTSTGKTLIHLILTTQKITTEYDKVNLLLSFNIWYQLYIQTQLGE